MSRVRLAIVDDAPFIRGALARLLEGDEEIQLVGAAGTGEELLAKLDAWRPDAVTLDLNMPGMGGLATLDRLMARSPLPVVILSTHSGEGAPLTVEALSRGAVDFIDKEAYSLVDFQSLRRVLRDKILHVARRASPPAAPARPVAAAASRAGAFDAVVVGASTGGPRAIETVLSALPEAFGLPVVIAQHMPEGFTAAFAERLNRVLPFRVAEARDGQPLAGGAVWIAPAGWQLAVTGAEAAPTLRVTTAEPDALYRPSVNILFSSAAAVFGARVIAVLLTGMGDDGQLGMTALYRAGAATIAQDEATSVVFGMPRAAIAHGAAREILPLGQIGSRLVTLAGIPAEAPILLTHSTRGTP